MSKVEALRSDYISASLDLYRDLRDAASEAAFFEVYGNMMSLQMADEREEIRRKGKFDPRSIAAVREVLDTIEEGSAIEGLARIAMLISKAGSGQRRLSQMQKTREILSPEGRSRICPKTSGAGCCRRRRSSWSSSPSARSARCRSSCARAADRRRAHALLEWTEAQPGWRSASGSWSPSCARCCRWRAVRMRWRRCRTAKRRRAAADGAGRTRP